MTAFYRSQASNVIKSIPLGAQQYTTHWKLRRDITPVEWNNLHCQIQLKRWVRHCVRRFLICEFLLLPKQPNSLCVLFSTVVPFEGHLQSSRLPPEPKCLRRRQKPSRWNKRKGFERASLPPKHEQTSVLEKSRRMWGKTQNFEIKQCREIHKEDTS